MFDPNRLTAVLEIKHKTMIDGTSFETKISVNKAATDLDLGAEFSYYVVGPQTDLKFVIRYSKEKEAIMTIYWLHPRGIFEHVEGKVNVTIPLYNPMVLKWKVHEKRASDYDVSFYINYYTLFHKELFKSFFYKCFQSSPLRICGIHHLLQVSD